MTVLVGFMGQESLVMAGRHRFVTRVRAVSYIAIAYYEAFVFLTVDSPAKTSPVPVVGTRGDATPALHRRRQWRREDGRVSQPLRPGPVTRPPADCRRREA